MSVDTPAGSTATTREPATGYQEQHGDGWVIFAGVMLLMIGVVNVIGGIAALDDANFYTANAHYVFSDLNTWGWVILITGAVQVLSALGIWARNQAARWLGVTFATINAFGQLFMLPAFPLWSLAIFAVDLMIIYGLLAYGGHRAR